MGVDHPVRAFRAGGSEPPSGLDWVEDHHDVFVEDDTGKRLGGGRLPEGVEGMARFHELVAGHVEDPADVVVATATDRDLFIGALGLLHGRLRHGTRYDEHTAWAHRQQLAA